MKEEQPMHEPLHPTASTPSSSSSSYRTVLFRTAESFPSDTAFFDACRDRLLAQYGVPTIPSKRKPLQVSVRCERKKGGDGCSFRACAAKRPDGRWEVHMASCSWQHSHPPSALSMRPRPAALDPAPRTAKAVQTSSVRAAESGRQRGKRREEDEPKEGTGAGAAGLPLPPLAPLPGPTDTFATFTDVYLAYTKHYIPSWGIGVQKTIVGNLFRIRCNRCGPPLRCPWLIRVKKLPSGVFAVDFDGSKLEHNHGPDPNILADPSWRPKVINDAAREALATLEASRAPPKKRSISPALRPPTKRFRAASPSEDELADPGGAPLSFSPLDPQHIVPLASPPLSVTSDLARPAGTNSTPGDLQAFLHSLHPSTIALASHLLAAGFTTPSSLAALVLLSPPIFDLFVSDLRARVEATNARAPPGERVTVVQLKLFEAKMREVRRELLE
ncbi:hypothetical protein JCM10450v2_002192 [Rhodotorula kratochvilovae]